MAPDEKLQWEEAATGRPPGFIVSVVATFLSGPSSILLIALAAVLGFVAVTSTPREEEPQIVVPMADVFVEFPGHSAAEVEQLVTTPLERLLWQIDGVEHVYSISRRDAAMVTVRFFVGRDRDRSMVRIRDRIDANRDIVPPGVAGWLVKPVEIDDVPIVTLTLLSEHRNAYELRRMADEMNARLAGVEDVFRTQVTGGYRREIAVEADPDRLAARGLCLQDIVQALQARNVADDAGGVYRNGHSLRLIVVSHLVSEDDVRRTVIRDAADRIVRIEDVAEVRDGPEEPANYVHVGFGPGDAAHADLRGRRLPAVTMAFSKKKGTNAVDVAKDILAQAESLRGAVLPADVEMLVTRNYGRIADEKVDGLLACMFFAIVGVVGLMAVTMGWRAAVVVGLAVPVSFAMALFVNYISGYTVNRVTLFALILSLGLVVDDPITNVDNIDRHLRMGKRKPFLATLFAVHEVIPPVIMSTLAIIISFTPMFFITGMMGPYMGPMAINVPLTVTFSTICALTFVPWVAFRLLKGHAGEGEEEPGKADGTEGFVARMYRACLSPFLRPTGALALVAVMLVLLVASAALMAFRKVPLKVLPFDNKDELQLVLDMPEGSTLEQTDAAVQDVERYLATVNEVTDFESYVGLPAPIDFNGLVRHYYMRTSPNHGDIRVNLLPKARRSQQSHAIALRIRDDVTEIAAAHGAVLNIVEVPPGPPVLATLTVEVYGRPDQGYEELIDGARVLRERLADEDGTHIAEIDDMSETPHERIVFTPDLDKASRHGLTADRMRQALATAIEGDAPGLAHIEDERLPVPIRVRLPLDRRHSPLRLGELALRGQDGGRVALGELGEFSTEFADQPIYHKDLQRTVFVTAECVGRPPGEIVLDMGSRLGDHPLPDGIRAEWAGEGEWQITVRVFRDLGLAFGAAMIGIYLLLVVQMRSFFMPMIVMSAIPLTIIGIAPGFYLLNVIKSGQVGGYPDPVFFTATAMIGMIALGGIVIRNSIVLIEFIQNALAEGLDRNEAILQSGAVRFRPIMLTAGTTMLGAWPITLDPVFSGLAWALIFGLLASTVFTLLVVPTLYRFLGPGRSALSSPVPEAPEHD